MGEIVFKVKVHLKKSIRSYLVVLQMNAAVQTILAGIGL